MIALTLEELFRSTSEYSRSSFVLMGDDPYLSSELKKLWIKEGFEINFHELPKSGPDAEAEDLMQGVSLFSSQKVVWLNNKSAYSNWSSTAKKNWERMLSFADSKTLILVIQVPLDKRLKWDSLNCEGSVSLTVPVQKRLSWIKRMALQRSANLDETRLAFLASLDTELIEIDNLVELWGLGGDLWAEKQLGWKAGGNERDEVFAQPAFAWVDAVISRDRKKATRLLKILLDEEAQEPLALVALLSKSLRILTMMELGLDLSGQAPFLIDRLKSKKGVGARLLHRCSEIDFALKSSPANPKALLATL